jgi:hypothetical protein
MEERQIVDHVNKTRKEIDVTNSWSVTITIMDITYRPIFYLNQDVSETGLCLRLQVESTDLGPTGKASPVIGRRQNPVSETSSFK